MKQNYKISLCALLLVGAVSTMAIGALGADKPKLAVLVVGMGSAAKSDDFAARLGNDLNCDGEYELATKDNKPAVATKLAELRGAHTASTPVDTIGLAAWGKANEIDLVQLVVQDTIAGTTVVATRVERVAQLVDCSTGKLVERGTYRMRFATREMEASTGLVMVPVTGGVFEMGCKPGRDGATCSRSDELPLHTVKVNDFRIGKYPITQAQWREVMGCLPSELTNNAYKGDNKPVIYVSYNDIVHPDTGFLAKLNALTEKNYRLPTEAEWEYAARGCSTVACDSFQYSGSSNTSEDVAWYNISDNNPNGPQPVGGKAPNGLGIYDMSGNVWEWCRDYYSANYYTTANNPLDNPENTTSSSTHVQRGGSFGNGLSDSRIARRAGYFGPSIRYYHFGFRVVLP
ncbi:MAG: formylglycine-generating enzyme family protein [Prevotellaceae bacterium]|jgi:formylglycine-generating enzyme required for sulfatase activity|nr:formylglycine-generating enzyme family protein [Prevotellaceae bacterium]